MVEGVGWRWHVSKFGIVRQYVIICAVLMVQSMYLAAGFGIILWFSTGVPPFVSWFINPFKYTVIAIYEYIYIYPDVSMKPSYIGFEESLANLSVPKKLQLRQQSSSWKAEKDWRSAGKSSVAWFQWLENQLCVNGIFLFGEVIYTWGRTSIARVDYSGNYNSVPLKKPNFEEVNHRTKWTMFIHFPELS